MKIGFRGVPKRRRPWISRDKIFITLQRFQRLSGYLDDLGIYIYGFPRRLFPERKINGNTVPDTSDFAGLDSAISAFIDMFNKRGIEVLFYLPNYCDFKGDPYVKEMTANLLDVYGFMADRFNDAYIVFPFEGCDDEEEYLDEFDVFYDDLLDVSRNNLVCKNDGCDLAFLRTLYHRYKMPIYLDVRDVRKRGFEVDGDMVERIMKSWDEEMIMEYGGVDGSIDPDNFWGTFSDFSRYVSVVINDSEREDAVDEVVNEYGGIV